MTHHAPMRLLALVAAAALFFAACDPATPSAARRRPARPRRRRAPPPSAVSSAATDAIYDAIEAQVLEMRGLPPTEVQRKTIDREALKAFNIENFDEENTPEYNAAAERLYKAFGLLPQDASRRQLYLDLLDSQVAGFYKPDDKTLYVASRTGTINGADKITFAHEYDHALQDANFTVFADQDELLDETDRALARAAIYEGDATLLMVLWARRT